MRRRRSESASFRSPPPVEVSRRPGLVAGGRRAALQAALLIANLPAVEVDLIEGAIVVLDPERVRVRRLPLHE
jgi:hypothetical protein